MDIRLSFKFKATKSPKRHRKLDKPTEIKVSPLVEGYIFIEDGVYKCHVDMPKSDEDLPPQLVLEFTPESYSVEKRMRVFTRQSNPKDKWTCYCRTKDYATIMPGNSSFYVPFAHNWTCKGWVVRYNSKLMFKFKRILCVKGYSMWENEEDD